MRELNQMAIPLILTSGFGALTSLINQGMIGQFIGIYAGAIGQVNLLLFVVSGVLGATAISFNINGSKSYEKKEEDQFNRLFNANLWLSIFFGVAIAIFLFMTNQRFLSLVYGFEGQRLKVASQYLSLMSMVPLLQLILFTYSSLFKIIRCTKKILIGSVISIILNLILNYLLLFGSFGLPQLGVQGVAIATIISMVVNIFLYVFFARHKVNYKWFIEIRSEIKVILKESIALMAQEILEGSLFVIGIGIILERIGGLQSTGYYLVIHLLTLIFIPMNMYATALLTFLSAKMDGNLVRNTKKLVLTLTFSMCFLAIIFRIEIIGLLNNDAEVISYTSQIMALVMLAYAFNPIQTLYKSVLFALQESRYVLKQTFIVNGLIFIMMNLLVFIFEWQEYGLFLGLFLNYLLLTVLFKKKYQNYIRN